MTAHTDEARADEMALGGPGASGGRADRGREPRGGVIAWLKRVRRFVAFKGFSSLTRRIVLLNLAGLCALVSGILYLSEFRSGLIDARIQSLLVQGEIIAAAIASSAPVSYTHLTLPTNREV